MQSRTIRTGAWALAAACAVVLAASAAAGEECVVRKGDTLAKLAKAHLGDEDRWAEIASLNGLTAPYTIHSGQKLKLPDAAAAASASHDGNGPAPSPRKIGDTTLFPAGNRVASPFSAPSSASSPPGGASQSASWAKGASWHAKLLLGGGIALLAVAGIVYLVGFLSFEVAAFNESFWWGIGTLFIHPVWLVFLIKFWDKARKGFLTQLAAGAVAACAIILLCSTPWAR
jgi:LysM repeat protein